MLIKDLFLKDIERDIRGVIKVAQTSDEDIYQELDEYVVTQELHRHFSRFYENYQRGIDGKTDKMGVWISGFFGSGKSHFLKILAYLLDNKEVKGKQPVEFFEDKVQDPLIYANMQRTANVETETILFNIDSKSALDNKSKEDAILRVFMKVFYEHRGYYGDIPGVAEMEKYLDKQGVYEAFKQAFLDLAGESWEDRRHSFYFDADYVIGALTQVTDMSEESARNWFENGVNNFEISIEKFAKDVKEYIDQKGPNFHLVFLVDEIGQYIGDSRNLMLNLQTLTEDLGTHAAGKVWVVVTSQESIDSIVKVKGDDFSRIQGRFDTRLSLSSISVDEVIKKRILEKHDYVKDKLKVLYPEKSAILKNLISFRESTADLRGFEHAEEFAEVYPFIPYQFKLLQNVFEQVRKHGSSGKHLSEGERSMLSAFKEAAQRFKQEEEGTLIPFHVFYDTIQEFLNPSISRVIEGAAENPALKDDPFNIDLLKVLFMVKYIKELPANLDNLATLMVTHMDEDKLELKDRIQKSLRKLIAQTLIQKSGDQYLFLTDDEQDINREIKQVKIEEDLVKRELANRIFNDLYENSKYRYSRHYDFSFNKQMDERNYGNQTSNIGIHILSPLSEHYEKGEQELRMISSRNEEVLLKLGANDSYVEEMEEALRIDEYHSTKNVTQLPENIQNILNNKKAEERERKRRVESLLEDAIKDGEFYINGEKVVIKGSTVKEKMNNAFELLVDNVYTKLGYVKEHIEHEREIIPILAADEDQLSMDEQIGTHPNELAKKDVYDFIDLQDQINKQNRVKLMYERFADKPYGWKQLDIAAILAELLKEQRIRIRYNAEYLEPAEDTQKLLGIFTKNAEADKGIILKRMKVDDKLIRTAKRVCREVFNTTDLADDEDGLIRDIRSLVEKQIIEIKGYQHRYEGRSYPGLSLLEKGLEYFEQFDSRLDNVAFFTKLEELEDDLMDWEEDIVYVKSFFGTDQKSIFTQGLLALEKYDENKAYLFSEEVTEVVDKLQTIINNPIPYRYIKDVPELVHKLNSEITVVLQDKKENALEKFKIDFDELSILAKQYGVSTETKEKINERYEELKRDLETFTDIYKVDATISQSASYKERTAKEINQEIAAWQSQKAEELKKREAEGQVIEPPTPAPAVEKEAVRVSQLVPVTTLKTEEDVEQYINTLSNKLKKIIQANKEIEFIE